MMRRRSSALYRVQLAISATLRPHPIQSPERGSTAQT
jgi:hypothetical protein